MLFDSNYRKMGEIAKENKLAYAKKHNYDLIVYDELLDIKREATWNKVLAIKNHLANYKWIFWTDADALIMNYDIKLESIIDENFNMLIVKDHNGINMGNFLIKNCDWSQKLLIDWYAPNNYLDEEFYEQSAFANLFDASQEFQQHVKVVPSRTMNSYIFCPRAKVDELKYQPGDFLIHFAGKFNKIPHMRKWSVIAQRDNQDK